MECRSTIVGRCLRRAGGTGSCCARAGGNGRQSRRFNRRGLRYRNSARSDFDSEI